MKAFKLAWIIHIFAFLHAAVAFGCRMAGVDDELLLTVLTMAMALIICMKKGLTIEFTASVIIVANILGFLLGTLGANILKLFISQGYIFNTLSTAMTTEILGWSIVAASTLFRHDPEPKGKGLMSSSYLKWLLLAASGIFMARLVIVAVFSDNPSYAASVLDMTRNVLSNSVSLIILVCLNILFIRYLISDNKNLKKWVKNVAGVIFMLFATLIESLLVGFGLPFNVNRLPTNDLSLLFVISLITQVTIYCIIYMVNYAITTSHKMQEEREKANMAQYRYLKLKRQVNPHFLFNSLNILDCLICEDKPENASLYTHKLAGIYRYMIKSEEEELVPLRDEMVFVNLYIDLLKVRFPEGFEVEINVPEEKMSRFVPPCSIQLLIENATKHNTVSVDKPLKVMVEAIDDHIRVCNNIIPKITKTASTGLGQQYIRQLYMDLSGKAIEINKSDEEYSVTLPLL